jgi:hypothetical protein
MRKFVEQIGNVLAIIDKHFLSETDVSIAYRINVTPKTVASWRKTGRAHATKAFNLVISFYEKDSLFDHFINDTEVRSFLEAYLGYGNRNFTEIEWGWVWRDVIKEEYIGRMTFDNALDLLEDKYKIKLPILDNGGATEYDG